MITRLLLIGLLTQGPVAPPPEAELLADRQRTASGLIAGLQSPFCPGLSLPACPSWHADTLRQALRRRVLEGESPTALRREMVARYGQYVLGEPTWSGFDVIGWVGPGILLLLSGAALVLMLRRRQRATRPGLRGRPEYVPPMPAIPAEERLRLEQRLLAELRQE